MKTATLPALQLQPVASHQKLGEYKHRDNPFITINAYTADDGKVSLRWGLLTNKVDQEEFDGMLLLGILGRIH